MHVINGLEWRVKMDWLEVTVYSNGSNLDELIEKLEELNVGGLVINDEESIREYLENNPAAWDYVDDEVFKNVKSGTSAQFYLEDSAEGRCLLENCRASLQSVTIETKKVRDEDWMNNWRQYFKPIEIGKRLLIVPAWEDVPPDTGRIILRIEPGQAFGTGAHASTSMCLSALEKVTGKRVLDLGCGSGILAVGALLFGADEAICCDIAEDAAIVCRDNARLNELEERRIRAFTCDILNEQALRAVTGGARFDIVFANIIADVIIQLAPQVKELLTPDGNFICSGIIDGRQDEVKAALSENGLQLTETRAMDGWHMITARRVV